MDWGKIRYFKPEEFACPCCGQENIQEELVLKLNIARELARTPFIITSGFRCERHNKEVQGKKNSSHLKGLAADIKATNSRERYNILLALLNVGFTRLGVAKNFIHVDLDISKPENVLWLY